jgi:hypothetical protein
VILPRTRLVQSAVLLLVLCSARSSFSQTAAAPADFRAGDRVFTTLPDSPSYSSSQQEPASPQQPAPPPQAPAPPHPDVHADQATDPCKKTSAALPGETEEQHRARDKHEEAECEVKAEEQQRFGGVIPQFNVVTNGQAVPLTPREKLNISLHTVIDPYTIGLAFIVGGGFGEIGDSHTGYGHGPSGFFKRVGASYADNVDGNIIGNALLPIVLHQDPRYFRKGTGPIGSRIVYSALSTFICRGDNGKKQFNTSNVLGNFISGAISNAYYPQNERGVGLTLENGVTVTLEGMVGAQLLEFAPDITQKIKSHHQRKLAEKAAAAAAASGQQPPAKPATQPQP